jgi:hypothetical protein
MLGVSTISYVSQFSQLTIISDNLDGRVLTTQLPDNSSVTVEGCIATCQGQGFTLAGLEWSVQCFCGDILVNGAVTAPNSDCDMACGGDSTYETFSFQLVLTVKYY